MKNFLGVIFLICSINLSSQNHFSGVKAGLAITKVSEQLVDASFLLRPSFGLTYDYKTSTKFNFGAEFLFVGRGYGSTIFLTDVNANIIGESEYNLLYNYLALPLKVGYVINDELGLIINLGAVPSLFLSGKGKVDDKESPLILFQEDDINKVDFAGLLEFGSTLKSFEKSELYTTLGFQYSISALYNFENAARNFRHMSAQLSFGYRFEM